MDFEHFLMEKHAEDYHGTDDDMPDAFNHWLENQDLENIIAWANEFKEAK